MLVIRFFRIGKKNQPSFKIVVTEKTNSSRRGRFVEQVGTYNPTTKDKTLNVERVKYWLGVGAKPSETIHNLLVSEKVIEAKKIDLHKKSKTGAIAEKVEEKKPKEESVEPEKSVEEKQESVVEEKEEPEEVKEEVPEEKPAELVEEKPAKVEEEKKEEDPPIESKSDKETEETPKIE